MVGVVALVLMIITMTLLARRGKEEMGTLRRLMVARSSLAADPRQTDSLRGPRLLQHVYHPDGREVMVRDPLRGELTTLYALRAVHPDAQAQVVYLDGGESQQQAMLIAQFSSSCRSRSGRFAFRSRTCGVDTVAHT